jgi:hypothetical protein
VAAYLTPEQAATRLTRFGITYSPNAGDLDAASDELDSMGPWIGYRKVSDQERAFPRSVTPSGATNEATTVPDTVLDAAALLAYHTGQDEGPAVTSESVLDRSVSYATPKTPQAISRISSLLRPYELKIGQRTGERILSDREIFERY